MLSAIRVYRGPSQSYIESTATPMIGGRINRPASSKVSDCKKPTGGGALNMALPKKSVLLSPRLADG